MYIVRDFDQSIYYVCALYKLFILSPIQILVGVRRSDNIPRDIFPISLTLNVSTALRLAYGNEAWKISNEGSLQRLECEIGMKMNTLQTQIVPT